MIKTKKRYPFLTLLVLALAVSVGASWAQNTQQALALLEAEQPKKGISMLKDLSAREPQHAEAQAYLGLAYLMLEQDDSAALSLTKALAMEPKLALAQAGMGFWLQQTGKITEAQAAYEKALQYSRTKDAEVLRWLAQAKLRQQQPPLAEIHELLDKALKQSPTAELYILKGDAHLWKGEGGPAVSNYEKALELNQQNAKAYTRLGRLYTKTKNFPLAQQYLQKAVAADASYAPASKELAELHYLQKQALEAAMSYERYLALTEYKHQARMRCGYFMYLAKEWNKAIVLFGEVLKTDAGNSLIQKYLAYSLLEAKQLTQAEEVFKQYFMQADAASVDAMDHEKYAKLLVLQHKETEALEQYKLVLQKAPEDLEALQALGELHFKQKAYVPSAEAYEKLISLRKQPMAQDYFALGRAYYLSTAYPQADSAFSQLLVLQPELLAASLWKARTLSNLDPDSEQGLAKPYYEKVIEKATADAAKYKNELKEAYSFLGYYYYVKSDKVASKAYWAKVKDLDPLDAKALNALKALQP